MNRFTEWLEASRNSILEELCAFLRIPSISAIPEHKDDVVQAAEFIAAKLRRIGFNEVSVVDDPHGGHPLILGQWMGAPGKPTIAIYAHGDVQPADPESEWLSPAFEPELRGDKLFGRGTADDKGQMWVMLAAMEGLMATEQALPCNIKVCFETEEEFGGAHIERFVQSKPKFLDGVDAVVVLDAEMYEAGTPTITTALRGLVAFAVTVRTNNSDLHSGVHGGAAPNANMAMAKMLAGLTTPNLRVRIKDFYRGIIAPRKRELDSWRSLHFDEEAYRRSIGARKLIGERRFSVLQRRWARPTLEINGVWGGYSGEGFKTVIPTEAGCYISTRLVPGMNPEDIIAKFTEHIASGTPDYATSQVRVVSSAPAMMVDTSNLFVTAAAEAFEQVFGVKTTFIRAGGSIPIAGTFAEIGLPVVITGITLPDCNMHAAQENLDLPHFFKGVEWFARFLKILAQ